MNPDAPNLLKLIRRDKTEAMRLLIECSYRPIYAFLRRLSGNEADAEDLTQQTFAAANRALDSFRGRSSPSSWIHGIAYHLYVDWRRRNGRMEARSDAWWTNCRADNSTPAELAADADLSHALYAAVDRLEPDWRDTIHLHYYQGLTLAETAEAAGVAVSTVKYRLRLALATLQREFSEAGPVQAISKSRNV